MLSKEEIKKARKICNSIVKFCENNKECQENEFYSQPVEVKKREYTKTIVVTEWDEIKKGL